MDAEVDVLRRSAAQLGMSAPAEFWRVSPEELALCYNGIGPEKWSSRFRKLTTVLLWFFREDALIHDYEFSRSKKSYLAFTIANVRFVVNACRKACRLYPGAMLIRIAAFALFLGVLCQIFGYKCYKE